MDDYVVIVLEDYVTTFVMIGAWLICMFSILFVSKKLGLPGLHGLAYGMLPKVLFYAYKIFDIWDVSSISILYSRLADLSIVVSLIISMVFMYRSVVHGLERYTDN